MSPHLIFRCRSSRKDPLPILEVLNIMSRLGRSFEEATVPQDIEGRTFVTAWFDEDDNGEGNFPHF
jgi:hypothetical protein